MNLGPAFPEVESLAIVLSEQVGGDRVCPASTRPGADPIIVETKFADALKPNQYGLARLAREHIFQLYAYIQSQNEVDDLAAVAEGVLLYPVVGQHLDESATIQGHRYRFLTVDLAASSGEIRDTLLSVPGPAA